MASSHSRLLFVFATVVLSCPTAPPQDAAPPERERLSETRPTPTVVTRKRPPVTPHLPTHRSPPTATAAVSTATLPTGTELEGSVHDVCVSYGCKCNPYCCFTTLFLPCVDPLPTEVCCDGTTTSTPENEGGGPSVSSKQSHPVSSFKTGSVFSDKSLYSNSFRSGSVCSRYLLPAFS